MREVAPISAIGSRLPQAGRIRIGKKGPKGEPQKLGTFRFTSSDRQALEEIVGHYGGTVVPWSDKKAGAGQFEAVTDAKELRIALPPDPLAGSPCYELWSGGGCQRRCDGETCSVVVQSGDGYDMQETPCLCAAKGALECKVTTRLSVILPDVRFLGVWRLDSHGWAAARELPGMVQLVQGVQERGIVRAVLRVEERTQTLAGRTNRFVVPVVAVDASMDALAAGVAGLGSLGAGSSVAGELPSGDGSGVGQPLPSPDDEIVDAEIVEGTLSERLPEAVSTAKALIAARQVAGRMGLPLPATLDAVVDERLISAVLDEVT